MYYFAVHPPSTNNEVPVIIEAASEARNTTADATSDNSANLPRGILSSMSLLNFLFLRTRTSTTMRAIKRIIIPRRTRPPLLLMKHQLYNNNNNNNNNNR